MLRFLLLSSRDIMLFFRCIQAKEIIYVDVYEPSAKKRQEVFQRWGKIIKIKLVDHVSDIDVYDAVINMAIVGTFPKLECDRTIQFGTVAKFDFDYNFRHKFYNFDYKKLNFRGLITGLSYAEVGIDTDYLNGSFYNFAISSQDLYYDRLIANYALSKCPTIESVIISLPYYALRYNLSKSVNKHRTKVYYELFDDLNHLDDPFFIQEYQRYRDFANAHFVDDFRFHVYNLQLPATKKYLQSVYSKVFDPQQMNDEELERLIDNAYRESNKPYDMTFEENKLILDEYVAMLTHKSVKILFVVCPISNIHYEFINKNHIEELNTFISRLQSKYGGISYANFCSHESFDYQDFYDATHLNSRGAQKLTQLLNEYMSSIWY